MSSISDELNTVKAGADNNDLYDFYYYLSELKELKRVDVAEAYIATKRSEDLPMLGSVIAEALYNKPEFDQPFVDREKWGHFMAITASSDKFGGAACLELGMQLYQESQFKAAIPWLDRAATVFNEMEAAIAIGNMYESGEHVAVDYNEAAKWYMLASMMPPPKFEIYFDLSKTPAKDGKWTDMALYECWLANTHASKHQELSSIISGGSESKKRVPSI